MITSKALFSHLPSQFNETLVKVLIIQSCPTLCNPTDYTLPGSSVHEILQAIILVWVAIPSPGGLPDPGIEPTSLALQAESSPSEPPGKPIMKYILE